ncbi:MAG: hypothetical protein AABY07_10915 [Nanoarchaeota archaeon]
MSIISLNKLNKSNLIETMSKSGKKKLGLIKENIKISKKSNSNKTIAKVIKRREK